MPYTDNENISFTHRNRTKKVVDLFFEVKMKDKERKLHRKTLSFFVLVVKFNDGIENYPTAKNVWPVLQNINAQYRLLHILQIS